MNTSTRFIEIDYNGNLITSAVTNMDFIGPGVIVSNVGSAVTINIPGSNGTPTGPNNSLQYNSTGTLAGAANLTFNPGTSILSVIGNVQAGYFVGDATRLFNLQGANIVGQIPFAAASNTANTALVAVTAGTVTNAAQPAITSVGTLTSVSVAGNVVGGNLRAAGLISASGNIQGNNSSLTGFISATANVIGGNINTPGRVNATGNITGGNLFTSGNVTGLYILGDGSQLINLPPSSYNNANVVTLLAGYGSNVISTTGNVTGGNLKTTGLISATGDITGGNVNAGATIVATSHIGATFSASGNITGGNLLAPGAVIATLLTGGNLQVTGGVSGSTVSAAANVTGGNVLTAGVVSAAGNITAGNIYARSVANVGNLTLTAGANAWIFGTDGVLTLAGGATLKEGVALGALALGYQAGQTAQGIRTVAIGQSAGQTSQSARAVAIGLNAGSDSQGSAAVAIGAFAGATSQGTNSIILNATGANLDQTTANTFTVAPVRNDVANTANVMFYNATSKEITYGNTISIAGNITGGNLSATGNITGNTAGFAIGYRDIPQVSLAANITAALSDSGKHYYSTSASNLALTLADNSAVNWPVGTTLDVVNRGTANITVAPGSGVSLYLVGNSTSADRVVTTYGMATVMNVAANIWMINGTVV